MICTEPIGVKSNSKYSEDCFRIGFYFRSEAVKILPRCILNWADPSGFNCGMRGAGVGSFLPGAAILDYVTVRPMGSAGVRRLSDKGVRECDGPVFAGRASDEKVPWRQYLIHIPDQHLLRIDPN